MTAPNYQTASSDQPTVVAPAPVRFVGLEGLRTIGVFAVFLSHNGFTTGVTFGSLWTVEVFGSSLRPASILGHLEFGPAIFFMISAFLLYRPYVLASFSGRAAPKPREFLRRRIVRVFPAYWLSILLLVMINAIELKGIAHWVKVMTLTQIYTEHDFGRIPILVPTWTLATEITFYGFLLVYAPLMRKWGSGKSAAQRLRCELLSVSGLVIFALAFRTIVYELAPASHLTPSWTHVAEHWLPGTIDTFALGLAIAAIDAYIRVGNPMPNLVQRVSSHPDMCALAAFGFFLAVPAFTNVSLGIEFSTGSDALLRNLFQLLCAFALFVPVVFGDMRQGWYRRLAQSAPLVFVGWVSYGIYLWHDYWIVEVLHWSGGREPLIGHFWLVGVTAFTVSLVCGTVSYYWVERPVLENDAARMKRNAAKR